MDRNAEFDVHADGYDAGMDNKLKALAGDSADDFVAVKVQWLLRRWPELRANTTWSILDYGCGTATLLRLMRGAGIEARLTGTDVSAGMLAEAARTWPAGSAPPMLHQQNGAATGLPSGSFDLVIISAVLHHVAMPERNAVYAELHRLLQPDGRLVVFEHNPWNPVTRYVVSHTPIDRNAVLLPPPEVTAALAGGGWRDVRASHLMFLPPRLGVLAKAAEQMFGWLPIGGQYAVTARK
jgi:SAM-dependent methyltransferase